MPARMDGADAAIDVILVNYRTPELALNAMRSVGGPLAQIFVTDNSGDLPQEATTLANVWQPGRNTYFAVGNNYWFERTANPLVLLLNPDIELGYSALLELRDDLMRRPDCWGIAPRLVGADGADQNYLRRFPTALALIAQIFPPVRPLARTATQRYLCVDANLRDAQVVEQPPAACLLVRREAVGRTLFHEDLRLFFNDAYLAWRLNERGGCWYEPSIAAKHEQRASIRRANPNDILAQYADGMRRYAALTRLRGRALVSVIASIRLAQVAVVRRREKRRISSG